MPASLENMPRRTPVMMMTPSVAPATCVVPQASVKIEANAAGSCAAFIPTMMMPIMRYANATAGMTDCETVAMRRTPPKITSAVRVATTTPTANGIHHGESSPPVTPTIVCVRVLACSELNAKGKHAMSATAKLTAIHLERSPRWM